MNKLFAWSELDDLTERTAEDLFFCNAEGGWDSVGFLYGPIGDSIPNGYKHGDPVVEVRDCGRFVALETWAPNIEEADRRFRWHERYETIRNEETELTYPWKGE
jgi:hypothetical protein